MKKIVKRILICIEVTILFICIGAITTAITKNIYASILIEQFKSQAEEDKINSTASTKLYKIESEETLPAFQKLGSTYYPGSAGDILISLKSEIKIPFVGEFISFFAGGHAALVVDEFSDYNISGNNQYVMESTGFGDYTNATVNSKYYLTTNHNYNEVIGLRIKMTEDERVKVLASALSHIGDPYNYSFIYDTKNKSYCSDLVSKAYSSIGVDLNKDGFTTSVYDLLVSNDSFISYYHYFDSNGVKHIYYLD